MTTNETKTNIGKTGSLKVAGLEFSVTITDHRFVFGRDDYRVKPVAGTGDKWVSAESIKLN